MYAHEETITELGISKKDLPNDLQARIKTFTNRSRFAKKPEIIEELENESDDLANQVLSWFNEEDDDFEQDDYDDDDDSEQERLQREAEEKARLEEVNNQNVNSHINNEVVNEPKEKSNSGWGIDTSW